MAKYSIEIAGPRNEYALFTPTNDRLRGRWDSRNVSHRIPAELLRELHTAVRVIPGMIITLDREKGYGRIEDPLGTTSEGQKILKQINEIFAKQGGVPEQAKHPYPTVEHKELSVDQVKEWAFYMRTLVDCNLAVSVPGTVDLPKTDEIRKSWPGKRRKDPLREYREEQGPIPYVDEVADKKHAGASN